MRLKLFFSLFLLPLYILMAQTKVSGYVFDENDEPVAYANVLFKGSTEGTTTDENGRFYLESHERWQTLI